MKSKMEFNVGDDFPYDRVRYRVGQGDRCEGDMTIQFTMDGSRWHRPSIAHSLILMSFKYQVEENNYGRKHGKIREGKGGQYLLDSLYRAIENGWEDAARKIEEEVAAKRKREE